MDGEFPDGLVLRTPHFYCQGPGSIPGWVIKILQAVLCGQKKKKKKDKQTVVQMECYLATKRNELSSYKKTRRKLKY